MSTKSARLAFLAKLFFAATALVALAAMAARRLVPSLTLSELFLYSAAGVVSVMAIIIFGAVCSLQISQFILRVGGMDAQWFWFSSEPKGLVDLREQQAEAKRARDGL